MDNHYKWIEKHFFTFAKNAGAKNLIFNHNIISSHGDKCYGYKSYWEKLGIKFEHGVAIYLLSYLSPFSENVRNTKNGWVDPKIWVVSSYK